MRVTKRGYTSETSVKWQKFCSRSWRAASAENLDIQFKSRNILFIRQIFWY